MNSFFIFLLIILLPVSNLHANEKVYDVTIRLGQGGFNDSRSPVGKLGGDQVAIDIKLKEYPLAINLSSEFYTNRPVFEAYNEYEITNLTTVNLLYISKLFDLDNTNYFFGAGIGEIEVPSDINDPSKHNYATAYNMELGINWKYFKYVGFYSCAKYLSASKNINSIKVIDFNEKILLIGITFNFNI